MDERCSKQRVSDKSSAVDCNSTNVSSSRLDQRRLILDDKGTMRCAGRIKYPVVSLVAHASPAKHHVTELRIKKNHALSNHTDIKRTLNRIRKRYWVLHGRQADYLNEFYENVTPVKD